MYDVDTELLRLVHAGPPVEAGDGALVAVETRRRDITRLGSQELEDADLVTASALLDTLTAPELERLVVACARVHCPVLITLSVTGAVALTPSDPLDGEVRDAFNAHQRRTTGVRTLLGPDAIRAAVGPAHGGTSRSWSARVRGDSAPIRPRWWRSGSADG